MRNYKRFCFNLQYLFFETKIRGTDNVEAALMVIKLVYRL